MNIDTERKRRYQEKLNFIIDKINNLPPYNDNSLLEFRPFFLESLFYRTQVATDAIMDVIAMLCKDNNIIVMDDYHNIDSLINEKILSPELGDNLKRLNGLRNVIVHKYNGIDEKKILDNLEEILEVIVKFVEFAEEYVK